MTERKLPRNGGASHPRSQPVTGVDVIVIGGGVIGCSIAYHLARAGSRVALVEAREVASAASGASAGGVRQQGRDPRELPLALRAIARWPDLGQELEADLDYHRSGHLTVAETEAELVGLAEQVARQQLDGLAIELVDAQTVRQLAPGIGPSVIGGSYCASDGHANPIWTTEAFVAAALRHGAHVSERTTVTDIEIGGGRVTGVQTTRGPIAANVVVVAAGAWSEEVARLANVTLPVGAIGLQMMVTPPAPHQLQPVLGCVGRQLSLKQLAGGQYLIGGGWPGSVDLAAARSRNKASSLRGSAIAASAIWPALRRLPIARAWAGLESDTPDGVPILGVLPSPAGLAIAAGFCGHGFALSPAIGEAMAGLILHGASPVDISGLRFDRFVACS